MSSLIGRAVFDAECQLYLFDVVRCERDPLYAPDLYAAVAHRCVDIQAGDRFVHVSLVGIVGRAIGFSAGKPQYAAYQCRPQHQHEDADHGKIYFFFHVLAAFSDCSFAARPRGP